MGPQSLVIRFYILPLAAAERPRPASTACPSAPSPATHLSRSNHIRCSPVLLILDQAATGPHLSATQGQGHIECRMSGVGCAGVRKQGGTQFSCCSFHADRSKHRTKFWAIHVHGAVVTGRGCSYFTAPAHAYVKLHSGHPPVQLLPLCTPQHILLPKISLRDLINPCMQVRTYPLRARYLRTNSQTVCC